MMASSKVVYVSGWDWKLVSQGPSASGGLRNVGIVDRDGAAERHRHVRQSRGGELHVSYAE